MKYYFELRKEKINKDGMIPIRLVVMNAKNRIRKSVEAKTKLEDWDNENNKINNPNSKFNSNYKEYQKSNKNITDIIQKVEKIFTYFEYNGIPFQTSIFNEKFDGGDVKVIISFFDAYDEFVKISKLTKTSSTITKYNSVKKFLTAFELHSNHTLRLDTCDFRFEESFMDYCFNTRKTLNNYYAKIVKCLKAFLNWSYERGYHSSLNFKKLKSKEEDSALKRTVANDIKDKLNDGDYTTLISLLEKELTKLPEKTEIHEAFIELMSEKCPGVIDAYSRVIKKVDNSKIPFSLAQNFKLAEPNNNEVKKLYKTFKKDSQIYIAINDEN